MFIIGYFLQALASVLHVLFTMATIIVIARAVLSWVSPDPNNSVVRIIYQLSEPVLYPIRRRVPYLGGMDFSPILVLLAVMFLDNFLVPSLQRLAMQLT